MNRWVHVLAGLYGARALTAWLWTRAGLDPDTGLYAQGSLGVYPSPGGRLMGLGEGWSLALLNVAACVALVEAVAYFTWKQGGRPIVAAVALSVAPTAVWGMFAGVDAAGVLLLVIGLYGASSWALVAAALTHLSLAPVALGRLAGRLGKRTPAGVAALATVVAASTIALLLTPYSGVIRHIDIGHAALVGTLTVALVAAPFSPFLRGRLSGNFALVAGGLWLAAALQSSDRDYTNARYGLALTAVAAIAVSTPRRQREHALTHDRSGRRFAGSLPRLRSDEA